MFVHLHEHTLETKCLNWLIKGAVPQYRRLSLLHKIRRETDGFSQRMRDIWKNKGEGQLQEKLVLAATQKTPTRKPTINYGMLAEITFKLNCPSSVCSEEVFVRSALAKLAQRLQFAYDDFLWKIHNQEDGITIWQKKMRTTLESVITNLKWPTRTVLSNFTRELKQLISETPALSSAGATAGPSSAGATAGPSSAGTTAGPSSAAATNSNPPPFELFLQGRIFPRVGCEKCRVAQDTSEDGKRNRHEFPTQGGGRGRNMDVSQKLCCPLFAHALHCDQPIEDYRKLYNTKLGHAKKEFKEFMQKQFQVQPLGVCPRYKVTLYAEHVVVPVKCKITVIGDQVKVSLVKRYDHVVMNKDLFYAGFEYHAEQSA